MALVDIHVHFMPQNVLDKVWAYFDRVRESGVDWYIHYRTDENARLTALRELGVRAVVSTFAPPPGELPAWVRSGPGRQDELLRASSVLVCGGGHGMLAKALLAGVPVVVVPGGGDQWEMANRVARQGSGVIVRPATVDGLRAAVARVLGDARFAAAAARAAATVAEVRDPVEMCHAVLRVAT